MSIPSAHQAAKQLNAFIQSAVVLALSIVFVGHCGAQTFEVVNQCLDSAWKDPETGIQDCTEALNAKDLTPYELVHSLNSRGWAYRRKGDYDHSIQDYDRAVQLKPDYAEAFNGRGLAYYGKNEYERAIQDFTQAIQLKPDYAEAFNSRGKAYEALRVYSDIAKAVADFDQAIRLAPNFSEAFFNRGQAFAEEGHFSRAIPDYTTAIRLRPDYSEAFVKRSDAYMHRDEWNSALRDLSQAIKLNPEDADTLFARSSVYETTGNNAQAIRDVTEVIHLKPNEVWPYWFRAMDYYDNGDYDRAILDLNRVVEAQPEINNQTVSYIHQRGLAYLYKGDYSQAISDFERVSKVVTWDFYREGLAYFYMGDFKAAEKSFDRGGQFIYPNVWAYLAARRAGDNFQEKLAAISRQKLSDWPGPVVAFYLDRISAANLIMAAKRADLNDDNPCVCDKPASTGAAKYHNRTTESAAYFYIGEQKLLSGDRSAATAMFRKSAAIGSRNTDEYQGALVELRRITFPKVPKPAHAKSASKP